MGTIGRSTYRKDGKSWAAWAIRSLSQRLKTVLRGFGDAARSAGASHLKGLPRRDDGVESAAAVRPYQVMEFDGHRLDID